jgi:mxaJ protein
MSRHAVLPGIVTFSALAVLAAPPALNAQQDRAARAATASAAPTAEDSAAVAAADSAISATTAAYEGAPTGRAENVLRVCADPDNLPFSNARQAGFENKIAELIARELGDSVRYTWWPQRRGFVRNTLRARHCDIVMGAPAGYELVSSTKPYYRSTYAIVTRADRKLNIKSLDDPKLRQLKIGVNLIGEDYTNPPPAHALGARGVQVAKGYDTFYTLEKRPDDIIDAVATGEIDVAIVWGPLAGYFVKKSPVPLTLTPLPATDRSGLPFAFDMALGVRRQDKEFKAQVEEVLERKRPEIEKILRAYNVPTLPVTASSKTAGDDEDDDDPR